MEVTNSYRKIVKKYDCKRSYIFGLINGAKSEERFGFLFLLPESIYRKHQEAISVALLKDYKTQCYTIVLNSNFRRISFVRCGLVSLKHLHTCGNYIDF